MTDQSDFEFTQRFRRLVVEQLALEAVRGGSWKAVLEELKKKLPEILEVEQTDIEREIAHLLEVRNWDSDREKASGSGNDRDMDNEPIDLGKEREQRFKNESKEQRQRQGKSSRPESSSYGEGVRKQVFEVIVRQGMAGAAWRSICVGPMMVNNIDPEEVQAEIDHRLDRLGRGPRKDKHEDDEDPPQKRGGGGQPKAPVPKNPFPFFGGASKVKPMPGKSKGKDATAKDFSGHDMKSHEQRNQADSSSEEGKDEEE